MDVTPPFATSDVATAFAAFPEAERAALLSLRGLIFETAAELGLAPPQESLKWGQPSYASKGGTPLRLGLPKTGGIALYAHCQTTVIAEFAALHGAEFEIEGNRAVHLTAEQASDQNTALRQLITAALTYHRK